jgi:glycosyltransferase involved in cell wall biosynthesis
MRSDTPDLPLVSVVTPSFNQAAYLEETIRSVLEQDYPNIEYIVIDGGSTDGSVELIRGYADRLAYWTSEPDRGQADAINKGWARATGDIVAFLNSDDYYLPGAISRVVELFRRNPGAGFASGQAVWVTESGEHVQKTRFTVDPDECRIFDLHSQTSVPQPAAFVRREVIEKVGMLDPSFHFGLDGEFFLRVLGNFPGVSTPDVFACMRLHEASKSVGAGTGFAPDLLRIARKVIDNPHGYPRCEVVPEKVLAAAHILSARSYYVNGAFRKAAGHLVEASRASPAFRALIVRRELPRLVSRAVLGLEGYQRVSARMARIRS